MQTTERDPLSRRSRMCEVLQLSETVIETPNKSNQSNFELAVSVTRTPCT
jgi:hypothetical protein